jgi:hypothetical protein
MKLTEKLNNLFESGNVGVLNLFIDKPKFKMYLSPGPMKVVGNLEYSVQEKDKKINVYSDDQIKQAQSKTVDDFRNVVWFVPGGYNFGIEFEAKDNAIHLVARPNNAVGKSIHFETIKGSEDKFHTIAKKYSTLKKIRTYLKKQEGKTVNYI